MIYCIVDLEATCWEGAEKNSKVSEIIEIGAVITDHEFNIIGEFDEFIRPVLNPILSNFCTQLTSIKQHDIDNADGFKEVMQDFSNWLKSSSIVEFYSWGNYDKNQLLKDCVSHKIMYPFINHVNLKNLIANKRKTKPAGLGKTLEQLGLQFIGTPHRGIDDVRNMVRVCKAILCK